MQIMEESHGQGTGAGKSRRADCQALFVKRFLSSGQPVRQARVVDGKCILRMPCCLQKPACPLPRGTP